MLGGRRHETLKVPEPTNTTGHHGLENKAEAHLQIVSLQVYQSSPKRLLLRIMAMRSLEAIDVQAWLKHALNPHCRATISRCTRRSLTGSISYEKSQQRRISWRGNVSLLKARTQNILVGGLDRCDRVNFDGKGFLAAFLLDVK